MILLTSTTDVINVVSGSTGNLDVHASYVDTTGTPPVSTPGRANTPQIVTATTTEVVRSPGSSVQRNLKYLSARNANATTSMSVTVEHVDSVPTTTTLVAVTLQPGDTLQYNELDGWTVMDSGGGLKLSPSIGRLLKVTVETTGTTFTTGPATNFIEAELVGGGGGGAGCTSAATSASAGGGGGAGGFGKKLFPVSPNTAYTYAIGGLGAGNSANAGGNGGDTTLTVGLVTVTAKGGTGAPVATAEGTLIAYPGGAGGVVGTGGDLNDVGQPGEPGVTLIVATPIGASGAGGSGPFGGGGVGITAAGTGNAGAGYGAGGGGAMTGASATQTGGAGTGGCIVFTEYS